MQPPASDEALADHHNVTLILRLMLDPGGHLEQGELVIREAATAGQSPAQAAVSAGFWVAALAAAAAWYLGYRIASQAPVKP